MNKIVKVLVWCSVGFYALDILTDYYYLFTGGYPLGTLLLYQIPLMFLIYAAISGVTSE